MQHDESFPTDPSPGAHPIFQHIPNVPSVTRVAPPGPGLGGALLWCALFLTTIIAAGALVVILSLSIHLMGVQDLDAEMEAISASVQLLEQGAKPHPALIQAMAWAMAAGAVVTVIFPWILLRWRVGPDWSGKVALRKPSSEHLLLTLAITPGFLLSASGLAYLFHQLINPGQPLEDEGQIVAELLASFPLWAIILVVGVAPGVGEELLCRGFLGRGLMARHGLLGGLVFTSVLFGILHLIPPEKVVVTAFMGAGLHYVYLMSRSLWLPMLLHFANNSLAVLLGRGDLNIPVLQGEVGPPLVHLVAVVLVIVVGYAFWLGRARLKAEDPNQPTWQPPYPGVFPPPPGSGTHIVAPSAGILPMVAVLATLAGLGLTLFVQ